MFNSIKKVKFIFLYCYFLNFNPLHAGLLPGTYVQTGLHEYKSVENLKVGDPVLSYSIREHRVSNDVYPIAKIKTRKTRDLMLIWTNIGEITVGPNQKFYNRRIFKFVNAEELVKGDKLYSPEVGNIEIFGVFKIKQKEAIKLYDISIEGVSLFFILNSRGDPILVHNFVIVAIPVLLLGKTLGVAVVEVSALVAAALLAEKFIKLSGEKSYSDSEFRPPRKEDIPEKIYNKAKKAYKNSFLSSSHRKAKRARRRAMRAEKTVITEEKPEIIHTPIEEPVNVEPEIIPIEEIKSEPYVNPAEEPKMDIFPGTEIKEPVKIEPEIYPDLSDFLNVKERMTSIFDVEDLKKESKLEDKKRFAEIRSKSGGFEQAKKDFDRLEPTEVREVKTNKGVVITGKLSGGMKINVRSWSSDKRATLEVQYVDKTYDKFRYD